MTGVSIIARIEDADTLERLATLVGRMDRPEGFHKNVGEHLLRSVRANFRDERAPDGTPWAPLAASTVRKRGSASPILTMRGYLKGSINAAPSADGVTIGTGVIYAAIHQLGGTIEQRARVGVVRLRETLAGPRFASRNARRGVTERRAEYGPSQIRMPARPYLGVRREDEAAILRIATQWLGVEGR